MIKVLLVDDEPNIRKGLKILINWERLGYNIIAEASNGREALLLIEKHNPQLVITDIKMPEVSGLDLIKECKNSNFSTMFIILSGHNEFNLAREALHLGAYKYLLKPLDEEELEETLLDFREFNEKGNSQKISQKFYLKTQLQKLLSDFKPDNIYEIRDSFNLTNEISYYYALIDLHNTPNVDIQKIEELIYESIPEGVLTSIILEKHSLFGLLIHSGMLKPYRNHINRFCINLTSELFKKYGYEASVYVGSQQHALSDLSKSRSDALEAADHRYYRDIGSVIEHQNVHNLEFNNSYTDIDIVDKIVNKIIKQDHIGIEEGVKELISFFREEYLSNQIIFLHINRLLNTIIKSVSDLNGDINPIINSSNFITNREEHIFLSTLQVNLLNLADTAAEIIGKYKVKNNTALELKEYIDNNYRENLSLKYVADKMAVNSAYLGQIFKKQTGVSFNQYLHSIRIREAKELLVTTNLKIYEVASAIGYQDVNYFMKKFESAMLTTPKTYRKNHASL